jgi:hypothetical protein
LVFTSRGDSGGSLWWASADAATPPVKLFGSEHSLRQIDVSPDGAFIGYTEQHPETGSDLWILPLDATDPSAPKALAPQPVAVTPSNEGVPRFSPDGRWLAYLSDEIGPFHTWVRAFPSLMGRWQLTDREIGIPEWSRSSQEIVIPRQFGMSVRIPYTTDGERFLPGQRTLEPLVPYRAAPTGLEMSDLAADGKTFLALEDVPVDSAETRDLVTFVLSFDEELRQRAPIAR